MKLAITSIQRNRNPWVLEWIAFRQATIEKRSQHLQIVTGDQFVRAALSPGVRQCSLCTLANVVGVLSAGVVIEQHTFLQLIQELPQHEAADDVFFGELSSQRFMHAAFALDV